MATVSGAGATNPLPNAYEHVRLEPDSLCPARSGLLWLWKDIVKTEGLDATVSFKLNVPKRDTIRWLRGRFDEVTSALPSFDRGPFAMAPENEGPWHPNELFDLIFRLKLRYADSPDTYVSGHMFVYYEQGEPSSVFAPDVMVVFGVPKTPRRVYKLWAEARAPAVVFEVSSRKTWLEDRGTKKLLCEGLGVAEYYLWDPRYEYLSPPLQGFRLVNGAYRELRPGAGGCLTSRALGLRLCPDRNRLELYDRRTGARLRRPADAEAAARQVMEDAREVMEHARQDVEHARQDVEYARQDMEAERTARLRAEAAERAARERAEETEAEAERLLSDGGCTWNSGIFLFKASVYLEELARFAPAIHAACGEAWAARTRDLDFIRVDAAALARISRETLVERALGPAGARRPFEAEDPLSKVSVGDVMTTEIKAPRAAQTVVEAARVATGTRHTQYPVVDEDGLLVGVLFAKDLDAAILEARHGTTAGSLALPPVLLLTPGQTLAEAALRLAQAGETRAPVVESLESPRLVGLLSSSDLVRARLHVHQEESGPSMADLG